MISYIGGLDIEPSGGIPTDSRSENNDLGEIFERSLPEVPLDWTGERLTTGTSGQVEIEHLHRYFLARDLCRGLDVLDVAAGEGYGTALISQVARSVVGIEISAEAVRYATQAYSGTNIRFLEGDARRLPVDDACVDVVVSFETIEHFYEHDPVPSRGVPGAQTRRPVHRLFARSR